MTSFKYFFSFFILVTTFLSAAESQANKPDLVVPRPFSEKEIPAGWKELKGVFGVPYTWVSPLEGNDPGRKNASANPTPRRSVVTFMAIDADPAITKMDKEEPDLAAYQADRTEWVEEKLGKVIAFKEYKKLQWPGIQNAHRFGFTYEILGKITDETSVWVTCSKKTYNFKIVFPRERRTSDEFDVDNMIQKFKCDSQTAATTAAANQG